LGATHVSPARQPAACSWGIGMPIARLREDRAVLAPSLEGRWLILDNRRSELIEDSEASSFTPLFAINHRGVQLFAAPYAKLPLLAGEVEAAPAAASEPDVGEWGGLDGTSAGGSQLNSLPLLM